MTDDNFDGGHDAGYEAGLIDAAAEIERLKSELTEAREIIKPIAEFPAFAHEPDDEPCEIIVLAKDLRRARAFLKGDQNDG